MPDELPKPFMTRAFIKMALKRTFAFIFVAGLVYGISALMYATKTIYKVKMNHAVVLERLGGKRDAITDVGWHIRLPFFSRIEQEVPLVNQKLYLGGSPEPMQIISRENLALRISALLTYRIVNLKSWAIENSQPLELLKGDYDGIVKDILQAQQAAALISEREHIKEIIFEALKSRPINEGGPTLEKKYGIEIVSFTLNETHIADKLVEATEEKKRRELIAEADNYAADQEAGRIRKLYAAYLESIQALQKALGRPDGSTDTALLQFLTQQKWATAYEKNPEGQRTVVIQNTAEPPAITLPMPAEPARKPTGDR